VKRPPVLSKLPEAKGPDGRRPDARLPETRVAPDARATTEPHGPEPRQAESRRPVPQPDKPARRPTAQQVKKAPKPVGDADDLINTVDMANASAFSSVFDPDDPRRKWVLLGILGVSAVLVILLLLLILWPSPKKPKPVPVPDKARVEAAPTPVKVRFNAPKGAVVVLDGVALGPGEIRPVAPGKLSVDYRCPVKSGKPKDETTTVTVTPGDGVQTIDIPCK
jgi:hypothetical protein